MAPKAAGVLPVLLMHLAQVARPAHLTSSGGGRERTALSESSDGVEAVFKHLCGVDALKRGEILQGKPASRLSRLVQAQFQFNAALGAAWRLE